MSFELHNTKDNIKKRMIKHALNFYEIENGNEHELDPIAGLIIEALSAELYNLSNDIVETQVRVLEKIANLLTPDFLTSPSPAHALIHAMPVEAIEKISEKTIFFINRKIASKNDEMLDTSINVHFTPIDNVQLFDARVAYLVTGNKVFKNDNAITRQLLPVKGNTGVANTVWLGIRADRAIQSLNGFNFCFDWHNLAPRDVFKIYQLLPLTTWYLNDLEIKIKPGFGIPEAAHHNNSIEDIFVDSNLLSLIKKDVRKIYDARFITIAGSPAINLNELRQLYPPAFAGYYRDNDLQKFDEKLLWIKVVFPAGLDQDLLDEISVTLNCFPIINRRLIEKKHRLNKNSHIIPLEITDSDQFLAVEEVSDEVAEYKPIPYREHQKDSAGTYTLRNGGVERFDARNAKELISYLLETLRGESIAFSAFGFDNISTQIKEINQRIESIEQKIRKKGNVVLEMPNYIVVKPIEGRELMYVEYWSTLAEIANNIKHGAKLQLFAGAEIRAESLLLLTGTTGGRSRLEPEDRLNAFKYGMMTRNRIVTKEDIRNFCHYELGDSIKEVRVEKGYEMSADNRQGFNRTIDVLIEPAKQSMQNDHDWQILCEQLKVKLHARSGMSNNYRVLIDNQQA